jgi:hypothetical protein
VLLEIGVEGTLTVQPSESSFCFLAQVNLGLHLLLCGGAAAVDPDFDQLGAGASGAGHMARVHAAGGDEVGLGLGVGGEYFEGGDEVLIREVAGFATHYSADETAGQAALAADVALVEVPLFGLALEGDAEVAHWRFDGGRLRVERIRTPDLFFGFCVAMYAQGTRLQQDSPPYTSARRWGALTSGLWVNE